VALVPDRRDPLRDDMRHTLGKRLAHDASQACGSIASWPRREPRFIPA
jgi:hypothetical protein